MEPKEGKTFPAASKAVSECGFGGDPSLNLKWRNSIFRFRCCGDQPQRQKTSFGEAAAACSILNDFIKGSTTTCSGASFTKLSLPLIAPKTTIHKSFMFFFFLFLKMRKIKEFSNNS